MKNEKTAKLQIINLNAAGIDVGAKSYVVAIDQEKTNVQEFGVYTKDHAKMIDHLNSHGIKIVAMESTGSYWQTLFNSLQVAGFDVLLVNGNQTKNVKGRKTDVIDCMWIQKLHSLGLLSGSFLLSNVLQELRTYYFHRQHLIEQTVMYANKMEKSLRLMNIRLDIVLRDVTGKSGLNIIEAILAGNRDPRNLASLADIRVKKSQEEIASALQGSWRQELLFELQASLQFYKLYEQALIECDKIIEMKLVQYIPNDQNLSVKNNTEEKLHNKKSRKHSPAFNVSKISYDYFGTDLFSIPGISHTTVLCLMTNVGQDIHKFPSGKSFQNVLNTYSNKLSDREQIHLFISSSVGLPFALGTRINTNIYPYVQTYQYDRKQTPPHREAILVTKELNDRVILKDEDRQTADKIRRDWENQLQDKIKPFIRTVIGAKTENWLQTVCETDSDYKTVSKHLRSPWDKIIDISATSLKDDNIDLAAIDIDGGFEYIEKTNSWLLDDGFLAGLKKRLDKDSNADLMQAGRLFFFHEALHYSNSGHRLTQEIANGIGQFPKVIEEADYQADAWALLNEYRYCCVHESQKLKNGLKQFFCNAIDTAVETMWSFVDTGIELNSIQIRAMNRFLNWYWQWISVENLQGKGALEEIVFILFNKPVIEFAGAPMELRAHRTFYKLNINNQFSLQLAAFINNRVHRFAPTAINEIVDGFKYLKGQKIKNGLKSFQVTIK